MKLKRMNCLVIFACFLSTNAASYDEILNNIKQYYESTSSKNMSIVWENYRESVEEALKYAMQETIGKTGLNVVSEMSLRLTRAYYEKQGSVEMIFKNLQLKALPNCWLPDAFLSLSSNVLKIESTLTKMMVNADYLLMRNKSDIIEDVVNQDAFKNSPFLFKQVLNMGQVTLLVDGCLLSGYIIARLKRGRVHLGHENFKLTNCEYSVEIYKKGFEQPAVIGRFRVDNSENSLGINHYLLMTLKAEFKTKLQTAIFSYVNTSAIFGDNIRAYEEEQENLFLQTSSSLTKLISDQNKIILKKFRGAVNIDDYYTTWDYWDPSIANERGERATLRLFNMVLTGLGTAYNSFTGGPYKLDDPMIGEQIRFSKLQVRGEVSFTPDTNIYDFSVEIKDFAVNIEINVKLGKFKNFKLEVVGYRDTQPDLVPGPVQTLIIGYVKKKVPEAIIKTIASASETGSGQLFGMGLFYFSIILSAGLIMQFKHTLRSIKKCETDFHTEMGILLNILSSSSR